MPRLSGEVVVANDGLNVSALGTIAEDNRSYLHVRVSGVAWLTCQRCLDPVEHVIHHDVLFQLWPTDAALPDDELFEDQFDALPVGNELDLVHLIEEEVLLGLPLSPRHPDCQLPEVASRTAEGLPFDVLAKLKRPH